MSRPLRILQVATSDRRGGAEGIARMLRDDYAEAGHASWLAVGHPTGSDPATLTIPSERRRLASAFDRARGREEFRFPGTGRLLDLPPERPDVLHCHNLHGWYFDLRALPKLTAELPVFLTLHDAWLLSGHCAHSFDCERWRTGCGACPDLTIYPALARDGTAANWRAKQRIYSESALHVATPSRWLMDKVDASMLSPGIVRRRVIPNGVDLDVFHPGNRASARARFDLPADRPVLLFVAPGIVTNPWKDWRTLVEALERIAADGAEPMPLLVGLGDEAPDLGSARVDIRFLPFQADAHVVADVYRAADLYVHAARVDTFPTTVLEALACGLPVVATAVGGIPEQIVTTGADRTGALTRPGDAADLASAIGALLRDPALRHQMGAAAAAAAAAHFDRRRTAAHYLGWFEEAAAC